ncbi:skin secretory protein xP2-like [Pristis pectinata]|uniref:skin secretory protein xP2-like n=1 Tax=Pristis pectinata TaxID=685728 RepID=UPI00223E0C4D|nr:skin secretory protein xP2-like [Pristis pectinata]
MGMMRGGGKRRWLSRAGRLAALPRSREQDLPATSVSTPRERRRGSRRRVPGTEGCARFLSPCLTGKRDVPECCPAAEPATVPSSDGLGEEGVRRPLMASARDQALEGAGLSTPRCPGAQASGQATTGCPRGPEPSSSPVTPNHQTHPAGDPEPVGAPHPGGEDAPDPGRGPSPTPAHQRTSVHTTNLHNPSLQVRSRHCPGDQDHHTGDPLPASQTPHPPDGGSVYRATAVFISDGDSDGSSPTGGIGAANRRQTGGGPEPCHTPAAGHAPCAWAEDSPLSRSGRSPETASGARAKARPPWESPRPGGLGPQQVSGGKRFSQSCLDLTATEAPVMAPRPWECPEAARPDTRSPTSSSLTGSLDSTETFLIDSPRGFGEREGMAGAARAPDPPRAAAHRPRSRVSRTSGPQPHQGAAPPHRRARSPRAPSHRTTSIPGCRQGEAPRPRAAASAQIDGQRRQGARTQGRSLALRQLPGPGLQRCLDRARELQQEPRRRISASSPALPGHQGPEQKRGQSVGVAAAGAVPQEPAGRAVRELRLLLGRSEPAVRRALLGPGHRVRGGLRQPAAAGAGRGGGETLQQIRLEHGSYFDVAGERPRLVALTGISSRSVEVYNRQGELLNAISNPFQNPRGITVNSRDQFLVTDTKRGNRVGAEAGAGHRPAAGR